MALLLFTLQQLWHNHLHLTPTSIMEVGAPFEKKIMIHYKQHPELIFLN
jgi:hypothetical protein